jgi:hypothetical protein
MLDEATALREWEVARELLANGNTRLHGMRRAGFSLVSAIVTASAVFLHERETEGAGALAAGIAAVSVALVVAMCLAEREVRLLQGAAAARASVIERHLGLELSDTISYRYEHERWSVFIKLTYGLFIAASCGLAWTVGLHGGNPQTVPIVLIGAVGTALVQFYSQLGHAGEGLSYADWSVIGVRSGEKQFARIMFSTLAHRRGAWPFRSGEDIWAIHERMPSTSLEGVRTDTSKPILVYKATDEDAAPQRCRSWLIDLSSYGGLYDVYVFQGRKGGKVVLGTMHRRLTVLPPASQGLPGAATPKV